MISSSFSTALIASFRRRYRPCTIRLWNRLRSNPISSRDRTDSRRGQPESITTRSSWPTTQSMLTTLRIRWQLPPQTLYQPFLSALDVLDGSESGREYLRKFEAMDEFRQYWRRREHRIPASLDTAYRPDQWLWKFEHRWDNSKSQRKGPPSISMMRSQRSGMQTLGTIRANSEQRQADINALISATQSTDPSQHTEMATLQRINQALI